MNSFLSEHKNTLIPLYLGITGHRDITDVDQIRLKEMIKEFIIRKQEQCPNTPVVVLTPLAEGADRIAALAAIECGIDFIATLPMPRKDYIKSFRPKESIDEFDKLFSKASKVIELPCSNDISGDPVYENPAFRHEQYYQIGMFIAKYSHTLIALWDGFDNNIKGGTASVVNIKRSGIPGKLGKTYERLQHLQTGPIYHIVTPHTSNPEPADPFAVKIYYSIHFGDDVVTAEKHDKEMLSQIDAFNKDDAFANQSLKDRAKLSAKRLFNSDHTLSQNCYLSIIAGRRGIIRELTIMYQTKRILALRTLFSLVVVAFIFLQIYAEFYHKPVYLIMYPLIMGIGAIWFYLAKRKRYEYKHEDYRALSEAFRVQFYLKVCGSDDNVSDFYLKRHRGELEWVLYTIRSSELDEWFCNNTPQLISAEGSMDAFVFLKKNWIEEQLKYFTRNSLKNNRSQNRWAVVANLFFLGAILSACLLVVIRLSMGKFPEELEPLKEIMNSVLVSCTHVFLVTTAALHGYSEKMVFSEHARNYSQMAQLFNIAQFKMSEAIATNNQKEAREIIWELAHEALVENGDWLLLHRSRPMEIPKG